MTIIAIKRIPERKLTKRTSQCVFTVASFTQPGFLNSGIFREILGDFSLLAGELGKA
jgi:hypothetical protein